MVIGETLARQARLNPQGEALVVGDRRLTWQALNAGSNRAANALLSLGARHGDRILLILGNSIEFVECYYALAKLGCVSAPVMPRSAGGEIVFIAETLRARFIVADAAAAPLVGEIRQQLTTVEAVVGVGDGHGLPLDYHRLAAAASDDEPDAAVVPGDRLTVKFTSGTTGTPKGCVRTHQNFIAASSITLMELPLRDDDCAVIAAPLAAGMAISQLVFLVMRGIRICMLPRFEPGAYLDLVERERPTLAYLMDGMSKRLCSHPRFAEADLGSLRLYHPVNSIAVLRALREQRSFRADFSSGFASSEAGGLVSIKRPEDYRHGLADPASAHLLESVGREAMLCRIECLDDSLNIVAAGEVGELAIRAPSVFQDYWERPDETARALRDGWLLTGDLASKDADGYIYLRGRKRDVVKTGGMSVYPAEIEPVLLSYRKITQAAVVGMPDPEWGERVVACVVATDGCTEEEVVAHCRDLLAAYKRPKSVAFFATLPTNDIGKIVKQELLTELQRRLET
jgi:acyl-CoA synthetase (AMP-forming)/AMP-acid ligase II